MMISPKITNVISKHIFLIDKEHVTINSCEIEYILPSTEEVHVYLLISNIVFGGHCVTSVVRFW